MKVVIDTNVFISGFFFGGKPREILNLIEAKTIIPCFIITTLLELTRLLHHQKFTKQRSLLSFSVDDFLSKLKSYSLLFPQPKVIPEIIKKEPFDNHFLACALISRASFIISGNEHLLKLKKFQGIPILTPKQFLKQFKKY